MLGVNAIQRHVITHAREIHTGAHNVIETLSGRLENRREILEDALRLGRNAPLDYLASGRVLADLTAEIDETTDFDRLGKRADRRRKFGRGNCGLAHGRLLWILGWMVRMEEPEVARFQCLVGAGRSHITRRVHAQGTHDSRSATIGSTLVARQAGM